MAESVDALVSNTSGAIHPGSIPGLGTQKENDFQTLFEGRFLFLDNGKILSLQIEHIGD